MLYACFVKQRTWKRFEQSRKVISMSSGQRTRQSAPCGNRVGFVKFLRRGFPISPDLHAMHELFIGLSGITTHRRSLITLGLIRFHLLPADAILDEICCPWLRTAS